MTLSIIYDDGHPAGWTNDLGIIADKNQWVAERLPGWRVAMHRKLFDHREVEAWCEENLVGMFAVNNAGFDYFSVWLTRERDVVLFKMRWG